MLGGKQEAGQQLWHRRQLQAGLQPLKAWEDAGQDLRVERDMAMTMTETHPTSCKP